MLDIEKKYQSKLFHALRIETLWHPEILDSDSDMGAAVCRITTQLVREIVGDHDYVVRVYGDDKAIVEVFVRDEHQLNAEQKEHLAALAQVLRTLEP